MGDLAQQVLDGAVEQLRHRLRVVVRLIEFRLPDICLVQSDVEVALGFLARAPAISRERRFSSKEERPWPSATFPMADPAASGSCPASPRSPLNPSRAVNR